MGGEEGDAVSAICELLSALCDVYIGLPSASSYDSTMTKVPGPSLLLKDIDGSYAVFDYKDNLDGKDSQMRNTNLSTYRWTLDNPEFLIFRHFCNHCGIPVFVTAYSSAHGGALASININSLDLEKAGMDRKELTRPEKLGYINGKDNLFQMQNGEPFPHGGW